jgi:hypothetical protein
MSEKVRHRWKWEYTSLDTTSAYCTECGMHRIQEWYDGNKYPGNWVAKYFQKGIKQRRAGNCQQNITKNYLSEVMKILDWRNGT